MKPIRYRYYFMLNPLQILPVAWLVHTSCQGLSFLFFHDSFPFPLLTMYACAFIITRFFSDISRFL